MNRILRGKTSVRLMAILLAVLMLFSAAPFTLAAPNAESDGAIVPIAEVIAEIQENVEVQLVQDAISPVEITEDGEGVFATEAEVTVHHIYTWEDLDAFLLGNLGSNSDTFLLMNDIEQTDPPRPPVSQTTGSNTAAIHTELLNRRRMGRGYVGGQPFTGTFDGQGYSITGLVLRPRRNIAAETGDRSVAANPYLNDFGFIRTLGDGAVIRDLTFLDAWFYDGGRNNNLNDSTTTAVNNNLAGGNGPIASGSNATASTIRSNASTHRGIVAGRVLPGATVIIEDVNVGNPIPAGGQTRGTQHARNIVSTSRHIGLWNGRMGGMIGLIDQGSTVHIINADVSVRLMQQALGSGNHQGGVVGTNRGTLNVHNTNVHVEMIESNWGFAHGNNTLYAGGVVGRNEGTLSVTSASSTARNTVHAITTREAITSGYALGGTAGANAPGGGTGNLSGSSWGNFRNAGRIAGGSTGPAQISDVNVSGLIFGLNDVGGVIGFASAPVIIQNVTSTGQIGGTQTVFDASATARANLIMRPANAGGIVGRATAPLLIQNVNASGNIFGGRGGADTLAVGGLVGSAAAVTITDSRYTSGTLDGISNVGGLVGRVTGAATIINSYTTEEAEMTLGGTAAAQRANGRGGIIGRVTASGQAVLENVTNEMEVRGNRGNVGGLLGRTQGRNLVIVDSVNYGNVRQHTGTAISGNLAHAAHSIGGIVGEMNNTNARIYNTQNHGNAQGLARNRGIGGMVGNTTGAQSTLVLENVTNYGNMTRTHRSRGHVGGLLGWMRGPVTIIDSENHGYVVTSDSAGLNRSATMGGLVARADRALTIIGSENHGDMANTMNRTMRMGGLVGYVRGRTEITDSANWGDIGSHNSTAGRSNHAQAVMGGIIGRSDMAGATAVNRRTVLTNVENHGTVGATGALAGQTVGTNRTNSVGGIIGRTVNRASNVYTLTNVTNTGNILGRNYTGGIVGFNDSLNLRIEQSENSGLVRGAFATGDARGHVAGFVARTGRNGFAISQSANTGTIQTYSTSGGIGTSASRLRTGSTAGFVGLIASGTVRIEESFNAGPISGVDRNTAGFVGISRGTGLLTIANGYNIGTVTGRHANSGAHLTRTQRSGNGILGFRDAGPVVIENVYNAGMVQGRPIYGSPAVAPNGAIGTYMTFRNVYWDTSVHTGVEQTIARGTISGANTDILTRGILPGLGGNAWLSGIQGTDGTFIGHTYPYLAWQTGGQLETAFFEEVREEGSDERSVVDRDGSGMRTTNFIIGAANAGTVRYFAPYTGAPHFQTIASATSQVAFERAGVMSLGVISTNHVVGFDVEPRTGVVIMAVDAIDGELVSWANFEVDGTAHASAGGIIVIEGYHPVDSTLENRYVAVSAFGYADNSYLVDFSVVTDGQIIEIPMTRVDIAHVRVEILNEALEEPVRAAAILPNSGLTQTRTPSGPVTIEATQTGAVATRHFHLESVRWRDILTASAPNFSTEEHIVSFGDFTIPSGTPSADNPHVLRIYLQDITVSGLNVRPVWHRQIPNAIDTGNNAEDAAQAEYEVEAINRNNPTTVEFRNAIHAPATTPSTTTNGVNSTGRWNLNNVLYTTEIRVVAPGFRTSEFQAIEDLVEFDEYGYRLNAFDLVLERYITMNVNVVQEVVDGIDEETGEPIIRQVAITNATLTHIDGRDNSERTITRRGTPTHFQATNVVDGEQLRATAVGFTPVYHTICWVEDVHEGGNTGTATSRTVTIVLEAYAEHQVSFSSATPLLGTVAVNVNGQAADYVSVLQGQTLNQTAGLNIATTPFGLNSFLHWSDVLAPMSRFTEEAMRELSIENTMWFAASFADGPVFTITAQFPGGGIGYGEDRIYDIEYITVMPGVERDEWLGYDDLNYVLEVGSIYGTLEGNGYAFWGWFTERTLDETTRNEYRHGYRRPYVDAECELEHILAAIETLDFSDTQAVEALFGEGAAQNGGNISLQAFWLLWGDVLDEDDITLAGALEAQRHIHNETARRFNAGSPHFQLPIPFPDTAINVAATRVSVDPSGEVQLLDVLMIQQYIHNATARRFNAGSPHFQLPIPFPDLVLGRRPVGVQ